MTPPHGDRYGMIFALPSTTLGSKPPPGFELWPHYCVIFILNQADSIFFCMIGKLHRFHCPCRGSLPKRSEQVEGRSIKPFEQVTLEPFERDHACVFGGYKMPHLLHTYGILL
jgi:hypothetical protein